MPHMLTSTLHRLTTTSAGRPWRSAAVTAITLAATACSAAGAGPAGAVAERTDCTPVRIIAARATGEDPGAGVIGSLARLVKGRLSASVTREALVYPICARGSNLQADFGYTDRYNRNAAQFVLRRLAAAGIS